MNEKDGWLRGPRFDLLLIFGTLALALAAGAAQFFARSALLVDLLFLANLWALGYHHVIATYTRLAFDADGRRRSFFLVYVLLPATALVTIALIKLYGPWILATGYLYAQWFHYARQSWGISRAYERAAPAGRAPDRSWITQGAFYGLPVLGLLYRSWQAAPFFLGVPVKYLPVTPLMLLVAASAFLSCFSVWAARAFKDWRAGTLPVPYACYMLSHFAVFGASYLVMPTLDGGWLVANVWHNLQYLLFVWMFNNRDSRAGLGSRVPLLAFVSRRENAGWYFLLTMTVTTAVYWTVRLAVSAEAGLGLAPLAAVYMAINYHHYIVDAVIWRASRLAGAPARSRR